MNKINHRPVVKRIVNFDYEVRKENKQQTKQLYVDGKPDIFTLTEKRVDKHQCQSVIAYETKAAVENKFL